MQLMKDLHQPVDYIILLYCNNQLTINLVENSVFYVRTKHVEVHYHFIRKMSCKMKIKSDTYVKKDDQVADLFTKGLSTREV